MINMLSKSMDRLPLGRVSFSIRPTINVQVFGAVKTFDLKDGGGDVAVTRANRDEYVDLYVNWLLVESVKGQYGPFER